MCIYVYIYIKRKQAVVSPFQSEASHGLLLSGVDHALIQLQAGDS